MAGFISGGSVELKASFDSSATAVSTVFSYAVAASVRWGRVKKARLQTYLAIFEREDQSDFVSVDTFLGDLTGDPALGGIGLPAPRADGILMRHGGGVGSRCVV
jgi:hypothetical protein